MKTSKITALVIAGLTATTIAGVALAEGPGGMGMMRGGPMAGLDFAAVDADKDGKITVAEMTAHRAARFAAADTDKDTRIFRQAGNNIRHVWRCLYITGLSRNNK